ncbi:hypothetical protein, partial [Streptomyces sp. NPDC005953]|uniref:hypothetical protein n=1 Tax=Streptomyces sp. NPDC005953 TaxID=3156719 RepID=UPI003409DD83
PPLHAEGPVTAVEMQTWRDARARADSAATALQQSLRQLGLPERAVRSIRPVVTHDGLPHVQVGRLAADAVEQLAEAIRLSAAPPGS